jgi:hypothetical protein
MRNIAFEKTWPGPTYESGEKLPRWKTVQETLIEELPVATQESSSNRSSSTGNAGRCSGFEHMGYGVALSRTAPGVVVENTVGEAPAVP